jgi:hypothetical protein
LCKARFKCIFERINGADSGFAKFCPSKNEEIPENTARYKHPANERALQTALQRFRGYEKRGDRIASMPAAPGIKGKPCPI